MAQDSFSSIDTNALVTLLRAGMDRGHFPCLTVTSHSMMPLLRVGDQVCLEPVSIEQLQAGDIITIATASGLLTHRYYGRLPPQQHLTRGDRPLHFDSPWPAQALVGRVIRRSAAKPTTFSHQR